MTSKVKKLLLAVFGLLLGAPVWADPVTLPDGFDVATGKVGLTTDKVELRSSGGGKITLKYADSDADSRTYTWPDAGTDAAPVMTAGTQTIAGVKTFSSAPTITGGLTAANIQTGSAKRQVLTAALSPVTGAAADTTVYRSQLFFGRAGTVTRITYGTAVDPVSGTNVIAVEKGSFTGNTMLSTATVSLNGTTANTGVTATLTATGADLGLTAAQPVCLEYNAGTQGTDAEQVFVTVEFEPTDF